MIISGVDTMNFDNTTRGLFLIHHHKYVKTYHFTTPKKNTHTNFKGVLTKPTTETGGPYTIRRNELDMNYEQGLDK